MKTTVNIEMTLVELKEVQDTVRDSMGEIVKSIDRLAVGQEKSKLINLHQKLEIFMDTIER